MFKGCSGVFLLLSDKLRWQKYILVLCSGEGGKIDQRPVLDVPMQEIHNGDQSFKA